MTKPTIEELCAQYCNEDAHSGHVARLASRLFEAMRAPLHLRPGLGRLLEAAALLHDVGYSVDRAYHASAGAAIVKRAGIRSFSSAECRTIAAAILSHQKRVASTAADTIGTPDADAIKIAAILRIADGLDHGHIQDADIVVVKLRGRIFEIAVSTPGYPGNLDSAEQKADIWRKTFRPYGIRITGVGRRRGIPRFGGVVRSDDSVLDAARKILFLQFRTIGDNRAGTLRGSDPERLHDFRTALRRFRTGLRLFRKHIGKRQAADLDARISAFSLHLGTTRDLDVWLKYLHSADVMGKMQRHRSWKSYLAAQRAARRRHLDRVSMVIKSKQYAELMRNMAYFLRVHLPGLARTRQSALLRRFAAAKMLHLYRGILKQSPTIPADAERIHALRKKCRRARYAAEFFEPVLGPAVSKLARKLKDVTVALGDLHDRDIGIGHAASARSACADPLRLILEQHRVRLLVESQRRWDDLRSPHVTSKIIGTLVKLKKRKPP